MNPVRIGLLGLGNMGLPMAINLLKAAAGSGLTLGPILLGVAKAAHILTPSSTVRRIVNMAALTSVDANVERQRALL